METVELLALEPQIVMIRLNRPERLNALTFELVADLHDVLDRVGRDPTTKVVILTGAGRGFCSGLDLKDFGTPPEPGSHPHMPVGTDGQAFMSNLTLHLRDTPQVVIAAVQGPAYGGGLALACASDLRVAGPDACFCSAFIRTGLSGADIGITYLILTGREVDAAEALSMGLVSAVAGEEEGVEALALSYARTLAGYTASGLRATKDVLWRNAGAPDLSAALALEIRTQNLLQHAPDVRAYMDAYRKAVPGSGRGSPS